MQALSIAQEAETLYGVYWRTIAAGAPSLLTKPHMDDAISKFGKGYGTGKSFLPNPER